jgi:hypothetical protein
MTTRASFSRISGGSRASFHQYFEDFEGRNEGPDPEQLSGRSRLKQRKRKSTASSYKSLGAHSGPGSVPESVPESAMASPYESAYGTEYPSSDDDSKGSGSGSDGSDAVGSGFEDINVWRKENIGLYASYAALGLCDGLIYGTAKSFCYYSWSGMDNNTCSVAGSVVQVSASKARHLV